MNDYGKNSSIRASATFFSLPLELRRIIYSFVLISPHSIKICSLPRKYLWNRESRRRSRPRKIIGQLLLVNRQIYEEASFVFYSKNIFAIGTGPYGSTRIPNLEGLECFLRNIPWKHTCCIVKLNVTAVVEL
jgi:hypothetical protein